MRCALISDDLTGALDASVVFAAAGLRTVAAVSPESFKAAIRSGADVAAVSLNSREGAEADAARKASMAAGLVPAGVFVFKKIDSRLKGHVRAEAEAVAAAIGASRVVLCPAIPEMGRIVRDGRLQGFGLDAPVDCRKALGLGFGRPGMDWLERAAE